jgi:CRP-like cAMP-binding protein
MATELLKSQLLSFAYFSIEELEHIVSKFTPKTFRQKELILNEGQVASEILFITTGLVRNFYLRDGKEVTTYFESDGGFITAYSSFITRTKSVENIQCLEDTEALSIGAKEMEELYKEVPQWQVIGRIMAEKNYICMADRIMRLQSVPAKEKYLEFLATSSQKIIQRTPLVHIASYLGIAPESLSRIRKNIS